jgi:gluconokinase
MTVPDKTVIVVMGVAGSGKTTIARLLAEDLGWKQTEADDLHGPENVAKMAAGIPLTDSDRAPWLRRICQRIDETEGNQVVTCSALRRSYRDILRTANARVRFLHLHGSPEMLASRIGARTDRPFRSAVPIRPFRGHIDRSHVRCDNSFPR